MLRIHGFALLRSEAREGRRAVARCSVPFIIIVFQSRKGEAPSLDTIEIVAGHDRPHSLTPPYRVVPGLWACMVAGLVQRWGDALRLQDFTSEGKLRPWGPRKEQAVAVAVAYSEMEGHEEHGREFRRIAGLMLHCGSALEFACATDFQTEDQQRRLSSANFCRGRLCPMCNWRRSQKLGNELSRVVDRYREQNPKSAMLLLTLTERNCTSSELGDAVDRMSKAFTKLRQREPWLRSVKAWFRSAEVTCPVSGEFHPHIHILLFVDENYFSKSHDLYIPQREWAQLWQECRGLSYMPVVDVRRVKRAHEVTKYVVKAADYLTEDAEGWIADAGTIGVLHVALKKRRLIAWSRELQAVRKDLGESDDDMDDSATGFPPEYTVTHRERYRWYPHHETPRRGCYLRVQIMPPKDDQAGDDPSANETG